MPPSRRAYAAAAAVLLCVEIFIALAVHDAWVRPYGGDSLAVVLVYLALRAATRLRLVAAAAAALGTAFLIEIGQGIGLLGMLGLSGSRLARTILGSGFDPSDFVAYAVGAAAVLAGEHLIGSRRRLR